MTVAPGYALRVGEDDLDAAGFDRAVSRAHRRIGQLARLHDSSGLTAEELTAIVADLDQALALWRGTPYLELEDAPFAVAERARLEELRVVALEDRAVAALELGSTPPSRASSRRSPRHTRCANGSGGCGRWP